MRVSNAFCSSAGVPTPLRDRVTATLIGSNVRPCFSTADLNSAIRSPISSMEAYWSRRSLWHCSATFLMDSGLPAPIHSGGWGFCAVGGSTTTSLELPVLASMRPRRVRRPGLENDFQGFVEALCGLLHGHAEAGELPVAIAHADPEIEPALRQQIERGGLLGQQHGIVPGQDDHRRAHPKGLRARGDECEETQRRRDLAEPGEVVLDEERAAAAERLRFDVVVDELPEPHAAIHVGAASLRLRAAQESESHLVAPCPAPRSRAAGITLHGKRRTFRNFPGGRGTSRLSHPPPAPHPHAPPPHST